MTYYVEINYRKGPTFSTRVSAISEMAAKAYAQVAAQECGFKEKVKKVTVRAEQ